MNDNQIQNRMGEPIDLSELRETAEKPSVLVRWSGSIVGWARSRTGKTVILALMIGVALAVGYWTTA